MVVLNIFLEEQEAEKASRKLFAIAHACPLYQHLSDRAVSVGYKARFAAESHWWGGAQEPELTFFIM